MEEIVINSSEEFEKFITQNGLAIIYLSTPTCNVCKVLKPKLLEMITESFPKTAFGYINLDSLKEVAGQLSVFTVPTILLYAEGKELIRESRNIDLYTFQNKIERIYNMIFE